MKRITTSTRASDPFGTGEVGFTNGDPSVPTPPTQLDDTFFNHVQEAIARSVEGNGDTVADDEVTADNYFLLDDAIQSAAQSMYHDSGTARFVAHGLRFVDPGGGLDVTLNPGTLVFDGRRYVITAAKLAAEPNTGGVITVPQNRDTYVYIAPEDPSGPASPPDRSVVHLEQLDVANGAAAPGTPAGTLPLARLRVTTTVQGVDYFNHGPAVIPENDIGGRFRPDPEDFSPANVTALIPHGSDLDIGSEISDNEADGYQAVTNRAFVRRVHAERYKLRSTTSVQQPAAMVDAYTFIQNVSGGSTATVDILDEADYNDGTTAYVEVKLAGIDPSDSTDGYSARVECHVHKDATFQLDGSGAAPAFEDGNGAIAAGVTVNFQIVGGVLQLLITGHTTDAMRFFGKVEVVLTGE